MKPKSQSESSICKQRWHSYNHPKMSLISSTDLPVANKSSLFPTCVRNLAECPALQGTRLGKSPTRMLHAVLVLIRRTLGQRQCLASQCTLNWARQVTLSKPLAYLYLSTLQSQPRWPRSHRDPIRGVEPHLHRHNPAKRDGATFHRHQRKRG